ncbi:unnamed protein product [Brassica rapa]|uniref:Uncharacterized protein n=1 Tax=Brassica campestris TaxID=3711 RepID=A0A8D9HS98_BRACM|nr:unnamed protein product [Brassica rapa]
MTDVDYYDNKDASGENNLIGQILKNFQRVSMHWHASSHFPTEPEVEFRSIFYVPPVSPIGQDDVVCIMKKCLVEKASECGVHVRDVPNDEECGVSVHEDKYVMNSLLVSLRTLSGL